MKYVFVPALLEIFLILSYFFGPPWLRQIISPDINREYGLLENLQVVLLLITIILLGRAVLREKTSAERIILAIFLVMGIFLVLEEIDYGLHYYRLMVGRLQDTSYINIHNIGNNTSLIKLISDIGMILLFVVAPCLMVKSGRPLIRYLRPSCYFILSMIVMFVLSKFAHYLNDSTALTGSLSNSISEFRELFVYYIFLIYIYDLIHRRLEQPGLSLG